METKRCTTSGCSGHAALVREESSAGIRYLTLSCQRCGKEQVVVIRPASAVEAPTAGELARVASAGRPTVMVETGRRDRTGEPALVEVPAPPQPGRLPI